MVRHAPVFPLRRFLLLAAVSVAALATAPLPAAADVGDCGQPLSTGAAPLASDALGVLRAAVGSTTCDPCVCDATGDGNVAASDAQRVLKAAVGTPQDLQCPACTAEKAIGPQGGFVETPDGRIRVTIEAGSVASTKLVSIEEAPDSLLPESLRANGASRVWRIQPEGQNLAVDGTLAVRMDGLRLDANKVVGSRLALLVAIDGDQVEFLADQRMSVDEENRQVAARADLGRLGYVAVVPLQTTVKASGFPATATVNDFYPMTIRTDEPAAEDVIDLRTASYTDDLFGLWTPVDGDITNSTLPKDGETVRTSSWDYVCVGAATATYTPTVRLLYDVIAPATAAPTDVVHRVFLLGEVTCRN